MRSIAVTVALLVFAAASPPGAAASPPVVAAALDGNWVLVEQSYGDGRANLPVAADRDERLVLEVRRVGGEIVTRVRAGRRDKTGHEWPAWVTDDGPLPLELSESPTRGPSDELQARYRVWPSANRDTTLDVVERYRLEGDALVGTVHVSFVRDGASRGEYVLHRRFERAP